MTGRGSLGRDSNQSATGTQQAAGSQYRRGISHQDKLHETVIMPTAACLARRGTQRCARQSRTMGPKVG